MFLSAVWTLILMAPIHCRGSFAPSTECEQLPFVPGYNLVGEGFDVVQMKTKSHTAKDKHSFTKHSFSCRYYSFRLHTRPPVTKEFMDSISSLPAKYNSQSESAYNHFIAVYGTHFLRTVDLGGKIHSITAVRTCEVSMKGLSVHDVSNCLFAEASVTIKSVNVSAQASYCKEKQKKLERSNSFSGFFSDHITEILGSSGEQQDILFNPNQVNGYDVWLKSLKKIPGVVSYTLSSLHLLVKNDPVRQASLQEAISKYITKSAISTACPSKCKVGHHSNNCACKWNGHQRIDSNCCPSKPGVATLTVTVLSAAGLQGDYITKTDGYVEVFYGRLAYETPVIWNNNFPKWNYNMNLWI